MTVTARAVVGHLFAAGHGETIYADVPAVRPNILAISP